MTDYRLTVPLPETVASYFNLLGTFGTVSYQPHWTHTKVTIDTDDLYDLGLTIRNMANAVSALSGFTTAIGRPEPTAEGHVAKVNLTDDVRRYFDILTGLAAADYTPGAPTATITIEDPIDQYELAVLVAEITGELESEFFPMTIDRPVPVRA